MKIGPKGLELIKKWEGYHTRLSNGSCVAYLDKLASKKYWSPGYKGLWTIGYGCTEGVYEGLVWTEKQATAALMKEIKKHEQAINRLVTVPLNQHQFDALVSLSYNLGPNAFPTLLKRLNEGDYAAAARAFPNYNKSQGKTVAGLTNRRLDEKELFEWKTTDELVKASRKLTVLKRIRNAIVGLFTAIAGIDYIGLAGQVTQFAQDNIALVVIGFGAIVWGLYELVKHYTVQDYAEDRYITVDEVSDVE